jgi:hypothetical protein
MARLLPFLAVLALAGFGCWVVAITLRAFFEASRSVLQSTIGSLQRYNARRLDQRKQRFLEHQRKQEEIARQEQERRNQAERQRIDEFRQRYPVQIVGVPDIELLRSTANQLDVFIEAANRHRPQFALRYDDRFRVTQFSYPFDFFFPRTNPNDDGPEPEPWHSTLESLALQGAFRELRTIYSGLAAASEFPAKKPIVVYDRAPAPQRPNVMIPAWSLKLIAVDGREIDPRSGILARVYASEIKQIDVIRRAAERWRTEIKRKIEEANEAYEMRELFIANENLKFREQNQTIQAEYETSKKRFEQRAIEELKGLRGVYKRYLLDTQQGVEEHFDLALSTLALPLPAAFPWRVFYDRDEPLIQVNQRVPFAS